MTSDNDQLYTFGGNRKMIWYVLAGILLIALLILFLFWSHILALFSGDKDSRQRVDEQVFEPSMAQDEKRSELIMLVDTADNRVLTESEKTEILKEFGGERTATYSFSPEEKQKILEALNR